MTEGERISSEIIRIIDLFFLSEDQTAAAAAEERDVRVHPATSKQRRIGAVFVSRGFSDDLSLACV